MELWTLKESYYKFLGHTDRPFRELTFRRSGDKIIAPDPSLRARLYTLSSFQLASLSLTSPPDDIKCLHL